MGAPEGNTNAATPDEDKLTSRIWINVTQAEKAACVRAAAPDKLSAWGRRLLVDKAQEKENVD